MTEPQDSTHRDGSRCHHPEHGAGTVECHRDGLAVVTFDNGVTDYVSENEITADAHLARARYLGADAALTSVVDHSFMSESDARSILSCDDETFDRYPEPTLTAWEEACGETLRDQVGRTGSDIALAWMEGRDAVWGGALRATALRVLGDVRSALELERWLENRVDALRIKSERS